MVGTVSACNFVRATLTLRETHSKIQMNRILFEIIFDVVWVVKCHNEQVLCTSFKLVFVVSEAQNFHTHVSEYAC